MLGHKGISMESRIEKYYPIHRYLALGSYLGFQLSDITGIATAAMLQMDKTDSSAYDGLRYAHTGLGFLSILTYFPQSFFAWRIMNMKQKLDWPANRKHRITGILTSIGVFVEIAGIATLAVLSSNNSSHLKTVAVVHCATSTFLLVVPFTFSLVNSR